MNMPLTQAVDHGHRNSSLLGAFALVLAFAFGVSTSPTSSAVAAGQQLVPIDLGLALSADMDTPADLAIPVASAVVAMLAGTQQAPQAGSLPRVVATAPVVFLARAPPR